MAIRKPCSTFFQQDHLHKLIKTAFKMIELMSANPLYQERREETSVKKSPMLSHEGW